MTSRSLKKRAAISTAKFFVKLMAMVVCGILAIALIVVIGKHTSPFVAIGLIVFVFVCLAVGHEYSYQKRILEIIEGRRND